MRSYLTGSFLMARMKVRYSPNHYLLLLLRISYVILLLSYLCNNYYLIETIGITILSIIYSHNSVHVRIATVDF